MFKKILKNRLFIFIATAFLFSGIGVFATTLFPSNQVTYNNGISGLKSTDVQGAIDELYSACFPPKTGGDIILEKNPVVDSGDGLYKDNYEEGRYFYKGKNVNNYITFNNETWRIVSIEPDKTIKIMRDASIGNRVWDSSYSNNWARPVNLNTYLNESYLTETLNSAVQGQIVTKDWSIGSATWGNNDLANQINDENSKKWNGKVALITMSEYIRSNSNQSSCGTHALNQDNNDICKNTTWMQNNTNWWTLSPYAGDSSNVFFVYSDGFVDIYSVINPFAVRPSLYLSSKVQIVSGDGSKEIPFEISM